MSTDNNDVTATAEESEFMCRTIEQRLDAKVDNPKTTAFLKKLHEKILNELNSSSSH